MSSKRIIIVGPANPYRGGVASFNERLAKEFIANGNDVEIFSFKLQYPQIFFPGKSQYTTEPAPKDIKIRRVINSINPFNWKKVGKLICKENTDVVIFSYWTPFMAPCMCNIARFTESFNFALVHRLLPNTNKGISLRMARRFCDKMDAFVTLSQTARDQIRKIEENKFVGFTQHPLYDNYGESIDRETACRHLGLNPSEKHILTFGLIRENKGLDWLMQAYAQMPDRKGIKLVVAGEFYSNGRRYHKLASELGISSDIRWTSKYIPDSQVKYYFSAADLVAQPYKSALQSGISKLSLQFGKPILITNVGELADYVTDGVTGIVVDPDVKSISDGLTRFFTDTPDMSDAITAEKTKVTWWQLTETILKMLSE